MIDVAFTPEELAGRSLDGVTAVVIDVVRASTTIVTALANGARGVMPVATVEEARSRVRAWTADRALLGGERGGKPPPGFECGNSPAEYTGARVAGRTVVFTTTNGTRALLAVAGARWVVVGGFVNAAAVSGWVERRAGGEVALVCSGEAGRLCLEDATCAGLLAARLAACLPAVPLSDGARAALAIHAHYARDLDAMLAAATWAQALRAQGRGADLPLCVEVDRYGTVPVWREGILREGAAD